MSTQFTGSSTMEGKWLQCVTCRVHVYTWYINDTMYVVVLILFVLLLGAVPVTMVSGGVQFTYLGVRVQVTVPRVSGKT